MMREDLAAILTDQQRAAALCLEEPDDHFLLLKQANRIRAVFSQIGATKNSIRAEADRWVVVFQGKGGDRKSDRLVVNQTDLGGH